jgi:hypothetical protein
MGAVGEGKGWGVMVITNTSRGAGELESATRLSVGTAKRVSVAQEESAKNKSAPSRAIEFRDDLHRCTKRPCLS